MSTFQQDPNRLRGARAFVAVIAAALLCLTFAAAAPAQQIKVKEFDGGAFLSGGEAARQAGSHPHTAWTRIEFETEERPTYPGSLFTAVYPVANAKNLKVELPPGFVGNPRATPRCIVQDFVEGTCALDTAVGKLLYLTSGSTGPGAPIVYNLVPPPGLPALFGANIAFIGPTFFYGSVRTDGDFGIDVEARNLSQEGSLLWSDFTFWGTPGDPTHDADRGAPSTSEQAFLSLPTTCIGPVETSLTVNSWQDRDVFDTASFLTHEAGDPDALIGNEGCELVPFDPAIELEPTVSVADSPSGLDVMLEIPQDDLANPSGLATAHLKDTTVTLAEGLTMNPSAADGLAACTAAQIGHLGSNFPMPSPIRFSKAPDDCPAAAKIGTLGIDTPLLGENVPGEHDLTGAVYLASQQHNPFGSDFGIYLVAEGYGVRVKLAGLIEPDDATGRLKTTFLNNPQLPFNRMDLSFKKGPRAPLATPTTCESHQNSSVFTSWARPVEESQVDGSFAVDYSPAGDCQTDADSRPFNVDLSAGSEDASAGSYSAFHARFQRRDGNQEFDRIELATPLGLTAKLAGIPYCSEAGIQQAANRTATGDGALERANPSCPDASKVGSTTVGAGAGPNPFYVSGNAYLAGPYKGAPVSLVFIVPVVAGPFDLGVQVVRAAAHLDERTAQITTVSDPIPQILRGVPVRIKDIRVDITRPEFTLNPTNCSELRVTGQIFGSHGAVTPVSKRFVVDGCRDLGFKPRLRARILDKGRKSTLRSFNPRTRFVVTPRPGDANIGGARVALPASTILDQSNLDTTCTRARMAADDCPAGSIVGFATAWSPLLDRPVRGPVYLAANGGVRPLPDIVAVLDGQVRVSLLGEISTLRTGGKARLQNTFRVVPDAPVNRFVLTMRGGKRRGLLVNSTDLCRSNERGVAVFNAHNGRRSRQNLRIGLSFKGCKKVRRQAARRALKRKIARKSARRATAGRMAAR